MLPAGRILFGTGAALTGRIIAALLTVGCDAVTTAVRLTPPGQEILAPVVGSIAVLCGCVAGVLAADTA
jgi:hypothetical protein